LGILTIFSFIGGLVLLIAGAEALVKGASKIASALGISSLVIGLTVVAFGTSSPELAISLQSTFNNQPI
jgi:cation:H+ antiporter